MSFKDALKNSVLEGFSTDISTTKICVTLGIAVLFGLYIYLAYRYKSRSEFYSRDFNGVLAGLPVVTAAIVLAMQSSIVISLGMVGALSIVRFRNAVKNSLDLFFLFWSISIGIICGAGIFEIALLLSAVVTVLLFCLDLLPARRASVLLVINAEKPEVEKELQPVLQDCTSSWQVKARSVNREGLDLIVEIKTKQEQELFSRCAQLPGIRNLSLMSHDGEARV